MTAIAPGLCHCGCGQRTPLARDNDRSKGYVQGQPLKWCQGHATRTKGIKAYAMKTRVGGGIDTIHRLRAAAALGKPLPESAVVHHANGTKRPDSPLVICQDQAYHMLLHFRMRVRAAGGNPNSDRVCGKCSKAKHQNEFDRNRAQNSGFLSICRECRRASRRKTEGAAA